MMILNLVKAKCPEKEETELVPYVAEAEQKARNYCNIPSEEALPQELCYTVANMALDLFRLCTMPEAAETETSGEPVKSVTMGDVSYTFDTTAAAANRAILDRVLLNYESDLKKFRRLRR